MWNAQIMATQGSMARCKVPDVMTLYEKCMKNMYKRNRCDEVTLSELECLHLIRFPNIILLSYLSIDYQ